MTMRLSQSSLTGTERTEVAVGTVSESSMLATVRAGAPRSTVYVGWSVAAAGAGRSFSLGTGRSVPLAGSAALVSGRGVARGAGAGFAAGVAAAAAVAGFAAGAAPDEAGAAAGAAVGAGAAVPVPLPLARAVVVPTVAVEPLPGWVLK